MFLATKSYYKNFSPEKMFFDSFFMKLVFLTFFNFIDFLQFYKSEKFHDFQTSETRVSENDATRLACFFDRLYHK